MQKPGSRSSSTGWQTVCRMSEKNVVVHDREAGIQHICRGDHQNWQGWKTTRLHSVQEYVEHSFEMSSYPR